MSSTLSNQIRSGESIIRFLVQQIRDNMRISTFRPVSIHTTSLDQLSKQILRPETTNGTCKEGTVQCSCNSG